MRAVRDALRWWWDLLRRVSNLDAEQRIVLLQTITLMEAPAFDHARTSVRETARILGFRDPKMWKGLSHHMKADQDRAENVFRHMEAVHRMRSKHNEPLTNPNANLTVELAYVGFAALRR